jgi:aspartate/methionine/tyrosine aminotransferase
MGGRADVTVATRAQVPPFHVMRVLAAAAARRTAGLPIYDLSAGQPSTPAPAAVRAAAHQALRDERIGYTMALGIPPLREAIAAHYARWYGLDVDPSQVAVTTGSSGGFLLAFLAAFESGDDVVVLRPGYPAYRNMLSALGCRVVEVPCGPDRRFRPAVDLLDGLATVPSGVVLAGPANPTGTIVPADDLAAITDWCDANGVRLISDEIYHGICYQQRATSAWQTSRSAIVVSSFSKYFSMTGWRLGWQLVPQELLDTVDRLAGNFALCPPTLAQHAACCAFDAYDELDANVARYARNRELLLRRLPELGMGQLAPADGAFYVYADVSAVTADSLSFCADLLDETGVAIAPGVDFDPVDGGRYVRMSFAGDYSEIAAGMDVLADWLAQRAPQPAL